MTIATALYAMRQAAPDGCQAILSLTFDSEEARDRAAAEIGDTAEPFRIPSLREGEVTRYGLRVRVT